MTNFALSWGKEEKEGNKHARLLTNALLTIKDNHFLSIEAKQYY